MRSEALAQSFIVKLTGCRVYLISHSQGSCLLTDSVTILPSLSVGWSLLCIITFTGCCVCTVSCFVWSWPRNDSVWSQLNQPTVYLMFCSGTLWFACWCFAEAEGSQESFCVSFKGAGSSPCVSLWDICSPIHNGRRQPWWKSGFE